MELDAGDFGTWLRVVRAAIHDGAPSDVPCGACTACCTSSQFVHVGPDETEALAHIPAVLLFPAPGAPDGYRVMGYDERGHCPMLVNGACSIYEHRPRSCRVYDCRVFAAAGVEPDQPAIAARVREWSFTNADEAADASRDAVRAAAVYLRTRGAELGPDAPRRATQLAVAAVEVHEAFARGATPDVETVRVQLTHHRRGR